MATKQDIGAGTARESRIDALLREMTTEEKVALLAGSDMWHTTPVERLGIPAIKVTDGPNGARGGGGFVGGAVTSACFPAGIALAATWDTELIGRIGAALGQEAKAKGASVLLGPTVNIHRSPLNGRNFECFSEDPHLSARMAVAYIKGLQSENVGATVKHYVCNDSEFERNTMSSEVDERTLREIYLSPFEAAVREADTWAVMSGYNRVNGTYAGEHHTLLTELLKGEWGFQGIVMSDWFGTKSTVDAANNGLDLEMPGPPAWRGEKLLAAVEAGTVDLAAVDEAARRMLRLIERTGAFEAPLPDEERSVDRPEHRALIRRAGAVGTVLLKNEWNALPLKPAELKTLAIIGPNARAVQMMGGGSAQVNAHYAVSPYEGIAAAVGDSVTLGYEIGCTNHKMIPHLDTSLTTHPGRTGEPGLLIQYHNNNHLDDEPVHVATTRTSEQVWLGEVVQGVVPGAFSASMTARIKPEHTGEHTFSLCSAGLCRLYVDGREAIDNWTRQERGQTYFGFGSAEVTAPVHMEAGRDYDLRVEYSSQGATMLNAFRLGHLPPVPDDAIERAVNLAAQSDAALLFIGLNGDWESEGHDRNDMELTGRQNELVSRVAAANPRTVVVLQTGSPVAMPWLDAVPSVLQAWYPGQECGNAIADVLFGAANPSGKLPQTFPVRLEDNPTYINYPGENGRVRYGEGVSVGYRYYDKKKVEPLFPFGHGLSYTSFSYGEPRLSAEAIGPDETLTVEVDVTNTGERAGAEVVQLYVRDAEASVFRPEKELKGFARVALEPGETSSATLTLDRSSLAYWDDARHAWVAEGGEFEVLVGRSSGDIRGRASFRLAETSTFGDPEMRRADLGIDTSLRELLADDAARAVLERRLPGYAESPQLGMAMGFTLSQIAALAPEQFPEDTLQAISEDLASLSNGDN